MLIAQGKPIPRRCQAVRKKRRRLLRNKIKRVVLNPWWFVASMALILIGTYLRIGWLGIIGGVLLSCPIGFIIWDYPSD